MQLDSHIQAIQQDLAATAGLGDEATAEAARRLSEALASTLHLRLLDLLGEAALEIGGQLEAGRVEVRLAGRDPELVVVTDQVPDAGPIGFGEEHSGRITLRLPESLKVSVEAAAAREGISTNAWLVRTIARMVDHRSSKRSRNRLQGYAQG
ncbi:MAG: toxin-antitoxin system HicB family antitoxin [Thermoleophilia bacterium]|nr:toxin-antitoxin system HicB family antitoxin [Thermoleophilia bacterium]MDH4340525.1 toxin-antitoxin system HicB family antitoxin [Thermoleophilia bacterium]MDH5280918.1 toxin-antitoxin system HicB family antitoxin [Thermoleophilia bacterium]